MTRRDAPIDVVLFRGSTSMQKVAYWAERNRYKQFFSGHKLKFYPEGVISYVAGLQ